MSSAVLLTQFIEGYYEFDVTFDHSSCLSYALDLLPAHSPPGILWLSKLPTELGCARAPVPLSKLDRSTKRHGGERAGRQRRVGADALWRAAGGTLPRCLKPRAL